jgi:ribosomal protein S18 acetylase RimI-like enzyme
MGTGVDDRSTTRFVRALEDNLVEAWASIGHAPGVEIFEWPGLRGMATAIPHPAVNGIFRATLAPDEVHARIDEVLACFAVRRLPMLWWVGPATRPADLCQQLEAHGLDHAEDIPGMAVDLAAINEHLAVPRDLEILPVADAGLLAHWSHIIAVGFEFPTGYEEPIYAIFGTPGLGDSAAWRHYLGVLQGAPVATASLFLGQDSAGIYCVATLPEARRQGVGAAVTLEALRTARALGYPVAILQSSAIGRNVYRRLGFREFCTYHVYHWDGQPHPVGACGGNAGPGWGQGTSGP